MTSHPFTGVNHVGYVVTDLALAGQFLVDVLGFERVVGRAGYIADPAGDLMTRRFGVHPRAQGEFAFFKGGETLVEILTWTSPDRNDQPAKNTDLGGRHLAVSVTDVPAAIEIIRAFPGTEVREPNDAGYIYVRTPFGLEVQLIPVQEENR